MFSLPIKEVTFKDLELEFFELGCRIARNLMQQFLEQADEDLARKRNKAQLRHKGKKTTTIKTLMGEVVFSRNIYRKITDDGQVQHIYLLDEALGFEKIGTMSSNLAEKIIELSCHKAYRQVAQTITELTNQSISHQAVWNIIQTVGQRQRKAEEELIRAFQNHELCGDREVSVLFEEADGIWLSMQGKSRPKRGNGRKEMKIGIAYEGWEPRYLSSEEYRTVGKTVFAGYHEAEEFQELREATLAAKYNMDKIKYRILNGDGASWIRYDHEPETGIFQLDLYHLSKSIIKNIRDKKARHHIHRWLKAGQFDKVYTKLEELRYQCDGLADEIEKLNDLETYIRNNQDGIISYKDRKEIEIPSPPEGLEYRTLGTMEKNVDILAKRMKGAKSWSEEGATNLAKIIALKMGENFKDKIAGLISGQLSEQLTERVEETITNTRKAINKTIKKNIYPLHSGKIPYSNCKMTNGRRVIRSIFNMQDFGELTYR
jgi:hypothetical protein